MRSYLYGCGDPSRQHFTVCVGAFTWLDSVAYRDQPACPEATTFT